MNNPTKSVCKKQLEVVNQYNRNNKDHPIKYFSTKCPDMHTGLSYWRRRFSSTQCYLNKYWNSGNKQKFTTGRICHLMHLSNLKKCNDEKRKCSPKM